MASNKLSENVKKNILDLNYNKYLQYYNTTIILLFTYIIGIAITVITKQFDYKDTKQLLVVVIISIALISIFVLLLLSFKKHMRNVLKEFKKLDL
jgi:low affinity Fe/Cu permease